MAGRSLKYAKQHPHPVLHNWALISPDSEVQWVAGGSFRVVLQHHRAEWKAGVQKLLGRWSGPTSPLHDLRRRHSGEVKEQQPL